VQDFLEGTWRSTGVLDVPPTTPRVLTVLINQCKELIDSPCQGCASATQHHEARDPVCHRRHTEEKIEACKVCTPLPTPIPDTSM
jgi:hypothetical protein